jgi:hypothetical protein
MISAIDRFWSLEKQQKDDFTSTLVDELPMIAFYL